MKNRLIQLLPHLVAILLFVIISSQFFSLVGDDYAIRQSDIQHVMGMSKEIQDYRLMNNDAEPLWSNNMFGGMPAYQTTVLYKSNLLRPLDSLLKLYLPPPVGALFMCMLGFYVLLLCLRVNPWLAIAGAISFGLSTINIIYLGAGHTSKVNAIGYMAPALGGLLLAFRGRLLYGSALFALAFGLHLASNHLQMTYYLLWLLAAVAIGETVSSIIKKQLQTAAKAIAVLAIATILAILPNAGNLLTTYEYSKLTTRGKSDLTILPEGIDPERAQQQDGLADNYILEYNMAAGEPWSLAVPNAKGGSSSVSLGENKEALKLADKQVREQLQRFPQYWGAQGASAGAFYFGAGVMFLFVLGLVFCKDRLRWPFAILSILAIALCMKEMHGLNDFFIHHFPMYNKFRDSKMILVLLQLMAPLMAILLIQQLLAEGLDKKMRLWFLGSAGALIAVFSFTLISPSITGPLISQMEADYFTELREQYKGDRQTVLLIGDMEDSLQTVREFIYREDAQRSLLIIVIVAALAITIALGKAKWFVAAPVLVLLFTTDMWSVASRYMNENKRVNPQTEKSEYAHYAKIDDMVVPYVADQCDVAILGVEKKSVADFDQLASKLESALKNRKPWSNVKSKERIRSAAEFGVLGLNTNYRVLYASRGVFSDAQTAYFHKSIGGYHAAKLKRYQEMIDFYINPEIDGITEALKAGSIRGVDSVLAQSNVLNMLNTKYVKYSPNAAPIDNSKNALGNAWFVKDIQFVANSNDEMLGIRDLDAANTAIVHNDFKNEIIAPQSADSSAFITLKKYETNRLTYLSESSVASPAIFSEIYYPLGWVCRIDGQETATFRANYILRGVMVPAGNHTIEWSFEPKSYFKSNLLNWTGSVLILLYGLGALAMAVWTARKPKEIQPLDSLA